MTLSPYWGLSHQFMMHREVVLSELYVPVPTCTVLQKQYVWKCGHGKVHNSRIVLPHGGHISERAVRHRHAWWNPLPSQEGSYGSGTGPNALYYGHGNATHLTPLGKIYTEQLCPSASA